MSEVIRHDLKTLGLMEDMAQNRRFWRAKIKVADFGEFVTYHPFGFRRYGVVALVWELFTMLVFST